MSQILREVFGAREEDLENFKKTVEDICKDETDDLNLGSEIRSGVVERHKKQKKFITLEHSWNGDDFVWHVVPHPRKTWKVPSEKFVLVVARVMDSVFPRKTKVDIFRPIPGTIPEWSFRAYGVRSHWSFDEEDLGQALEELLIVLNTLV